MLIILNTYNVNVGSVKKLIPKFVSDVPDDGLVVLCADDWLPIAYVQKLKPPLLLMVLIERRISKLLFLSNVVYKVILLSMTKLQA